MKVDGVTLQIRTSEFYRIACMELNNGCVLGGGHLPQNWSSTGRVLDAAITSLSYAPFE